MKRSDFLKEMGNSLFQTIKSVYEPFIQEDLEKVAMAAEQLLEIKWVPLINDVDTALQLEIKFMEDRPIIISRHERNIQVMDGICPVCSNLIVVTTLYSTGKCLKCEKEYNFKTKQGQLKLNALPLKFSDQMIYIGIQKHAKQGGMDA